jgi:hypothetical protein
MHIDGEHSGARGERAISRLANQLLAQGRGASSSTTSSRGCTRRSPRAVLRYVREHPDDLTLFLCGFNKAYLARTHFAHELPAPSAPSSCRTPWPHVASQATVGKTTYPAEMNTFGVRPASSRTRRCAARDWEPDTLRY